MYADTITKSMQETIYETDRRRTKQMEYNKLHGIVPRQVAVKSNALANVYGGEKSGKAVAFGGVGSFGGATGVGGTAVRGQSGGSDGHGRVSAANSYDDPQYIPSPSDLGKGKITVGFGHDAARESNSAFVDGYLQADLAAVLQDPVIRSMSRSQVEKAVETAKANMKKASAELDFQAAARFRDEMWALQQYLKVWRDGDGEA